MTTTNRVDAVRALLEEAEAAHGIYESTELDGVYDQGWPSWYADYAVDHGLSGLLGHPVHTEALAQLLAKAFQDFRNAESTPDEPWAVYAAQRIAAEL